jgi:putative ABC transport system permease protein
VRLLRRALWRDVLHRRAQFLAVVITIVLGVALFGASFDAFQNLTASYQGLYESLALADLSAVAAAPSDVATALAGDPDVAATTTRTVADVPMQVGDHRFVGRVVGLPPDGRPAVDQVLVLHGSNLDPAMPDGVLVEQHMAAAFSLAPGDSIQVLGASGWRTVRVLGVVASPEYLWPSRSRQEVLVPPDQFGVLFASNAFAAASPPGTTHGEALIRLAADAPAGSLDRVAAEAVAAGASSTQTLADQPSNAALQEDVGGFGELSLAFPLLFLGAGALAMAVLLGRIVATHRAQIGALRANGMRRRTLLSNYLLLGILVGVAGSIPGAVIGGLLAAVVTTLYTGIVSVPTSVIEVRPVTVIVALLIGPLAGALAAFGPARAAAATSPAEAMRGVAPIGAGSVSLLERLIPPLRRLPMRWLVALRGLGRNRRRSLSTIVGIALATSLIFVSWAMVDTVQVLLDRQFVEVQRADATVVLTEPVPASRISSVVGVSGVAASEPELTVPATVVAGSNRYATTLLGLEPGTSMHAFRSPGGQTLDLPTTGVLLGASLRDRLGVAVGDEVTLEVTGASSTAAATRAPPATTTVTVAGFIDEPFGTYAYASLATVAGAAGLPAADPPVSTALVKYAAGADRTAVQRALSDSAGVAAVVDSRALYNLAQSFMGLFYVFIGVMLVLGGVMAFALIFNTLSANVMERAVELTALRTLGMRSATIGRLVTAENLLLTVVALVPGLVVAYAMAYEFMASFSSDLFSFDLAVRPTTFLGTAAAILVAALVSQWPSLRAVNRLDLAQVVRERAT